MKLILGIQFLMLFSLTSFANTSYDWKEIYKSSEEAKSSEGFKILKTKYPAIFGSYSASIVYTANINTFVREYVGNHTCSANDPRLRFEGQSYGLCEKASDSTSTGSCFQTATYMPANGDPCL